MDNKKIKDLIKKNPEPARGTVGTNPSDPWSAKANLAEDGSLDNYLKSRGINPQFLSTETKISHAKSSSFIKWKNDRKFESVELSEDSMLDKFLLSRGINPSTVPTNIKVSYAKSASFIKWKQNHVQHEESKPSALEKFRKASDERQKKHDEIQKNQSKDGSGSTSAIDRLEKHLNKEETLNELDYDTVKSLYSKRRELRDQPSKKSKEVKVNNVKTSISRLAGSKTTQNQPFNKVDKGTHYELVTKEEVELNEDNLDSIAKKHGMEFKRTTYGAGMTHKTKGEISINRYGEWHHYPAGSKSSKAHGDSEGNFSSLDKHLSSLKEEFEQIDEISKSTLSSYKDKSSASLKNAQVNRDAAEPGKNMSKAFANLHAKSDAIAKKRVKGLIGYMQRKQGMKPTSEDVFQDPQAATQTCFDGANNTNDTSNKKKELSKSARIIKSLYKKHNMKEDTYDWEKDDKNQTSYGKKPKISKDDGKSPTNEKPDARAVLSGGTTLTGDSRDTLEIDPMMKNRPDLNGTVKDLPSKKKNKINNI